jgi:hypothetical protein
MERLINRRTGFLGGLDAVGVSYDDVVHANRSDQEARS